MTLFAFILAISLLVTIHELGHYCVAKLCHVRVLRFAVGFGRPLWMIKRGGTEWALCSIPLGGYVKLLDERSGLVHAKDKPFSFNTKPVGWRVAITLAGPLANLLVAMLLSFFALLPGEEQVKPVIGTVIPQTPAALAGFLPGERIVSINTQPILHWQDVQQAILQGSSQSTLLITVTNPLGVTLTRKIVLERFMHEPNILTDLRKIGLSAERILPVIGYIDPNGSAAHAGLKVGDVLRFIDHQPIENWQQFATQVRNHPGQLLPVVVERHHRMLPIALRIETVDENGFAMGKVGLAGSPDMAWHRQLRQFYQPAIWEAFREGIWRTLDGSWVTLLTIGHMILGDKAFSDQVVAGPVTMARLAGAAAHLGWLTYLKFLAFISMVLGVLNLLPIPMLDGGRLVYYAIEFFSGRPVSHKVQEKCDMLGMLLLYAMMCVALFNDFNYLFAG
ncbi:MAG: RIP metalloprotease RseP [Neisseriales bacterium]|nr:MAG: RIP metalloprotease RseP [Neisseriales bacterium]